MPGELKLDSHIPEIVVVGELLFLLTEAVTCYFFPTLELSVALRY